MPIYFEMKIITILQYKRTHTHTHTHTLITNRRNRIESWDVEVGAHEKKINMMIP